MSQQAFAAVVYLGSIYEDGNVAVKFSSISKTKVAPTKKQIIPRLELLAPTINGNDQGIFLSSIGHEDVLLDRLQHCTVLDKGCQELEAVCRTSSSSDTSIVVGQGAVDILSACKIQRIYHPVA